MRSAGDAPAKLDGSTLTSTGATRKSPRPTDARICRQRQGAAELPDGLGDEHGRRVHANAGLALEVLDDERVGTVVQIRDGAGYAREQRKPEHDGDEASVDAEPLE